VPERVPWGVLEGIGTLGAFVVLQVACGLVVSLTYAGPNRDVYAALPSFACGGAMMWMLLRVWSREHGSWRANVALLPPTREGVLRVLRPLGAGVLAYLLVVVAVTSIVTTFRLEARSQDLAETIRATQSPVALMLACVVAVGLAPVVEEVLFRGIIYLPLRARVGVVPAAIIVSCVFSAIHNYPLGAAQFLVLSVTFIALLEATGSLWVPIFAHSLYNAVNFVLVRYLASV